jgi:signal transduction histidine kinase
MIPGRINKKETVMQEDNLRQWTTSALSTVIKLSNIIGFLPINLNQTLSTVVEEIYNLFSPQMCCIFMVAEDKGLEPVSYRTSDGTEPDLHINSAIEACIALRDCLAYVASCETVCPNRKISDNIPLSHVCIPMVTGSDIHGVLSVTFKPERILNQNELNVLLSISNQTAAAIQRHHLFEKLRNEKAEIERAYRQISTLNEMLRKKIEELEDTQQRLIQSEKLAAAGVLSAGLCHEINNPISILLNRIECLKMEATELSLSEVVLKDLDVIYSNASKVSSIVQDLLIFSRHHHVEAENTNIKHLIEQVVEMLYEDIKRSRCTVDINIPSSIPSVYGDPDRLEQVFRNLISNAIDAMPGRGNIYIEAAVSDKRPGFLEVRIRDEGEGIAEENLHRIFDPFFTTKKLGRGSGLGLSICYGIIKNHGGDIEVKSRVKEGTVFTLYLPLENNGPTSSER